MILIFLVIVLTEARNHLNEDQRRLARADKYRLKGYPFITDCGTEELAKKVNITVKDEVNFVPKWSNWTEAHNKLKNPIDDYIWSFRMVQMIKRNGNNVEEPIDISAWLKYGGTALSVPPYGVTPGHYKIYPKGTKRNPKDKLRDLKNKFCHLFIIAIPPVVVISGGTYRVVPATTEIKLTGEESFDTNTKIANNENFQYKWKCTQKQSPTFCTKDPISTESKFKIPAQFVENDDMFNVTLTVESVYGTTGSFMQTIEVRQNAAQLEITCEKNCPPVSDISNYNYPTCLRAKCVSGCRGLKNEHYNWTIEVRGQVYKVDYRRDTQFGRIGTKLFMLKKVFEPGEYAVIVKLTEGADREGHAYILLNFEAPPNVTNCHLVPNAGETMVTFFLMNCTQKDEQKNVYEFIVKDKKDLSDEKVIVADSYPAVFQSDFQLPDSSTHEFLVRVSYHSGPATEIPIKISVIKSQLSADKLAKFYDGRENKDSISNLLNSEDLKQKEAGIRRFHALVDHLLVTKSTDKETRDFVEDLKYKVIKDILNAPITSINEVGQIGDAITKLMEHNQSPSTDPLLAKFTTTVCRKMMDKHLELIRKEKFPLNLADKAGKVSGTLNKCLETNSNPNFEIMAPVKLNITTEASVVPEIVITENYANYVDHNEDYYKNLDNLKEATYNIFNATAMSAKVVALTTAVGEKFVEVVGKKSATVVAKDQGDVLANSKLSSFGVVLIPSQDFAGDDHNYDILMSTWNKDILWWNRGNTRVSTDIAGIEFWHSTCKRRVNNFKEPAQLFFKIKDKILQEVIFIEDKFVVPGGYNKLSGENLSRVINVRRITLPKGKALRVQFTELSSDALDVVILNFKFPTAEDFGNGTITISNDNSSVTFVGAEDFDTWCYIGILANKEMVAQNSLKSLTYKFSTTVACCIRWVESKSAWEPACKTENITYENVIKCGCNNFSIIAGYLENIGSYPQQVVQTELELVLQSTKIVFITLAATFGLYCFMILFATLKRQSDVYYLADNTRKHRFAYLLSIKTGGGRNSGTTSNVTIKLIGDKNSSNPHVLNYPDPKLHLLQKFNHDLFLLTTKHHLGDIQKIELWFDCLGPSPDWFCKDITVYDMQQYTSWYFNVRKRLAVIKGDSYVELSPAKTDSPRRFKFAGQYHTWHFWHKEENFAYVKRLTVLLSTLLMMYVTAFVLFGVPLFLLKDGFDAEYDIDVFTVIVASISSFAAFLLHIIIVWCFRFSNIEFSQSKQAGKMPFGVTAICWFLLIILITASASFLIVLGFWLPYNKSLIWLTSCVIGLLLIVLLYENIFAFIQNICCKLDLKYNIKLKDVWDATETQRELLYKHFGNVLLRPYFKHLYRPLKTTQIQAKQIIVKHRRGVISELEDLVMFSIYFITLYVVILANKDDLIVRGRTEMKKIMEGEHTRSMDFSGLESTHQIYDYINFTLIWAMQPVRWYGNFVVSEPGMMVDMTNKYIGIARVRQQRMKSNVCSTAEPMHFLNSSCVPEFSFYSAERGLFGYATQANLAYLQYDRLRDIWKYSNERKTGSLGTIGEFAAYSGGGYVAYLGRTLYNSYANFGKLLERVWIDQKTRSIFIEFLTYNANYNVFSSVKLLFEQSATGYTFKHVQVFSVRMLFVQNEMEIISIVFFALFVAWVAMLFLKQSVGVVKNVRNFYRDVWFLTDCIIVAMSVACIALFALRMHMIKTYLNTLEKIKHNEFLNYFYLFYLEDFLTIFAAILVCIATIRLWKFLRFGMMFRILERTLSRAAAPLLTVIFAYSALVTAFALTFVLLYGNNYEQIDLVVRAIRLLVTMALKAGEIKMQQFQEYKSAVLFFTLYGLLLKVVIVLFIMIIVMSYSEAQMEFSAETSAYNIKHYVQEQFKYIPRLIRYKYVHLKGGEEVKSKVHPKPDKFLHLNSFSIDSPRMKTMMCVTQCVVRNSKKKSFGDYDVQLMLKVCHQLFLRSKHDENEFFFKGRVKGKRIALVDEKRIFKIADVVSILVDNAETQDVAGEAANSTIEKCVKMIRSSQDTLRTCGLLLKLVLCQMNDFEMSLSKKIK